MKLDPNHRQPWFYFLNKLVIILHKAWAFFLSFFSFPPPPPATSDSRLWLLDLETNGENGVLVHKGHCISYLPILDSKHLKSLMFAGCPGQTLAAHQCPAWAVSHHPLYPFASQSPVDMQLWFGRCPRALNHTVTQLPSAASRQWATSWTGCEFCRGGSLGRNVWMTGRKHFPFIFLLLC